MAELKKRLEADIFTAILCFLVMLIHITSEAVNNYDKNSILYAIVFCANKLSTFVVPAFIFVSAMKYFMGFALGEKPFNYTAFIVKRILKIYIPYVLWVVGYYFYFIYRGYFPFSFRDLGHYIVFGDLVAHFYFVIIIMQFYLLMPVWRKIGKIKGKLLISTVIVICAAIALFMVVYAGSFIANVSNNPDFVIRYNDRIFTSYLLYWVAGIFCGIYYNKVLYILQRYRVVGIFAYLCISILHITFCYLNSRQLFYYKYAEHMHMVFCFLSIYAFYTMGIFLKQAKNILTIFETISSASFYIYLSHCLVLFHTEYFIYNANITSISARLMIKAGTVFTIPAILSILYVFAKKKFSQSTFLRQKL